MQELIISVVIGGLFNVIVVLWGIKRAQNLIENEKKELKKAAEDWLNSEVGAKALYSIGMLIGAGAKQSIGLNVKGGKLKFQDILAQVAINWAGKAFNIPGTEGIAGIMGTSEQPNEPSQGLNKKSYDKVLRSA